MKSSKVNIGKIYGSGTYLKAVIYSVQSVYLIMYRNFRTVITHMVKSEKRKKTKNSTNKQKP